jgi:hypothetical protein
MGADWVNERFKRYQENQNKARETHQSVRKATADAPSMFELLVAQIEKDIREYNQLFKPESPIKSVRTRNSGIRVDADTAHHSVVTVELCKDTTIIKVQYANQDIPPPFASEHFEVVYNQDQDFRYKDKAGILCDGAEASERILDSIFFK